MPPAARRPGRSCWAWPIGSTRSPGSARATPGSSSPSSAPTRRSSPRPGTLPPGPG
jgi:hypothetical protein